MLVIFVQTFPQSTIAKRCLSRSMINNINYELANQERVSARVRSRVERLEDIFRRYLKLPTAKVGGFPLAFR
jgi:hypothetical protein